MPSVRHSPLVGLAAQVGLLVWLAATGNLGLVGAATGLGFGLALYALLTGALRRSPQARFGPANWVTLTRATLVGAVTALIADTLVRPDAVPPVASTSLTGTPPLPGVTALIGTPLIGITPLIGVTIVALLLDAVDGQVARRTGTVTELGARFDMEVDAFLILVLSLYVSRWAGIWVLAIGFMRYAYVVAGWVLPWLRGPVPPRYWRKVVAAIQGIVLAVAAADLFPRPVVAVALVGALALLIESFGRDVGWLWRQRLVPAR